MNKKGSLLSDILLIVIVILGVISTGMWAINHPAVAIQAGKEIGGNFFNLITGVFRLGGKAIVGLIKESNYNQVGNSTGNFTTQ